jgi:hypothetical protein
MELIQRGKGKTAITINITAAIAGEASYFFSVY